MTGEEKPVQDGPLTSAHENTDGQVSGGGPTASNIEVRSLDGGVVVLLLFSFSLCSCTMSDCSIHCIIFLICFTKFSRHRRHVANKHPATVQKFTCSSIKTIASRTYLPPRIISIPVGLPVQVAAGQCGRKVTCQRRSESGHGLELLVIVLRILGWPDRYQACTILASKTGKV